MELELIPIHFFKHKCVMTYPKTSIWLFSIATMRIKRNTVISDAEKKELENLGTKSEQRGK